jgi:hypothetical protein
MRYTTTARAHSANPPAKAPTDEPTMTAVSTRSAAWYDAELVFDGVTVAVLLPLTDEDGVALGDGVQLGVTLLDTVLELLGEAPVLSEAVALLVGVLVGVDVPDGVLLLVADEEGVEVRDEVAVALALADAYR